MRLPSITEITTSSSVSNRTLRDLAERAKGGRSKMFVARFDECEVGFLCYDDWSDQSIGFIYEIFVLPAHRGQRIGRSLLSYAEKLAGSLSCATIRLEPRAFDRTVDSSWLRSWYAKHGYVPTPDDPTKMEKAIAGTLA